MMNNSNSESGLAASLTKAASLQTYHTIRLLADRERVADAYRAYAYFRWVDDTLDADSGSVDERSEFIRRQKSLVEQCYLGELPQSASHQEMMLVGLIQNDMEENSGLQYYLRNMMEVMEFDMRRRGRLISQIELNEYTRLLACAITEAMHHFIGHRCYAPQHEARTLAVAAAHITHMLRDTMEDVRAGYFNIPREVLVANYISPRDVQCSAYRVWVKGRVELARTYFKAGREYMKQVENPRCRLAGFAYTARFEWLLDTIEREGYWIRPHYSERKSLRIGLRMALDTLSYMVTSGRLYPLHRGAATERLLGGS